MAWAKRGEGRMIAHQAKKLDADALEHFRDRFQLPLSDEELDKVPFLRPPKTAGDAVPARQREALGGPLPARRRKSDPLPLPPLSAFNVAAEGDG